MSARPSHTLSLVLLLIAGLAPIGCAARGQRAVAKMSPDQREFIAHGLTTFTPRSSVSELDAAFGTPLEASPERRVWQRAGAEPGERIEARFAAGRLVRLRVYDLGPTCGGRLLRAGVPVWLWELAPRGEQLAPAAPRAR